MANGIYNRGKFLLASGLNLGTADLRVLLVKSDYTFNADGNFVSDLSANEVSVGGYSRQTLGSKSVVEDDTNDFAYLYAANATFSSLVAGQTVGGAVLFINTGSDATAQTVAFYDVTDTATNGGDITIGWAANSAGAVLQLT